MVVAALIMIAVRESVTFAARQSVTAARTLRAAVPKILSRHWRIFPVLVDLFVVVIGILFFVFSYSDKTLATTRFVALSAMIAVAVCRSYMDFFEDLTSYVRHLRNPEV